MTGHWQRITGVTRVWAWQYYSIGSNQ